MPMFHIFSIFLMQASILLQYVQSFDTNKSVDELLKLKNIDDTCPKMVVSVSCIAASIGIWDDKGSNLVFDTFSGMGNHYSGCYNPDECYLFQFSSWTPGDCEYNITMDEMSTIGNFKHHSSFAPDEIVFAGNCENYLDTENTLYVFTYPSYTSNVTYTFYRFGQSSEEGFIQEGSYNSFTMNELGCSTIVYDGIGVVRYFVVEDGETNETGPLMEYTSFGSCPTSNCTNETLVILNNDHKYPLSYNLNVDGEIVKSGFVENGTNICFDSNSCNMLTWNGSATYFFLRENDIYEVGLSTDFPKFGMCKEECDLMPVLSTTLRGMNIVTYLATISGMSALVDITTPQYKAACWIIYDDVKNLTAFSSNLVQRYVLGLFYIATNGPNWIRSYSFLSGKNECDWGAVVCNDQEFVKYMRLSK